MNKVFIYSAATLVLGFILGTFARPVVNNSGSTGMMGGSQRTMQGTIDRHFIEQMIPHHEGAIQMARVVLERSKREEIQSLANGVIEAQTRENDKMRKWYEEWFGGVPATNAHGMGVMHMGGMEGNLEALRKAADVDLEFIRQMIPHHEMAIMMARRLASATERKEMKELADQIITSQSREITMMQSWSQAWSK